jgi:hypothetical protein
MGVAHMDYNKIIKEQEQIINELTSRNRTLSEMILIKDQYINELYKIIKDSSGDSESVRFVENKIEYIGRYLLSRAKRFEDKGATLALLEIIKVMVQLGRPLKGALAEYLISAIDFIFENRKLVDAPKKAFLLTGVSSNFGKKRKIGRAVESLLQQGFKKQKQPDKRSAYFKVANDICTSMSNVEKLHSEYLRIRGDIEPEFEKVIEVGKLTLGAYQEQVKTELSHQTKSPQPGMLSISTKDKN